MTQPTTPDEAIAQNVLGPKKTTVGNQTIEEYSIDELIKASNHVASRSAASVRGFGIRTQRIIPTAPGDC